MKKRITELSELISFVSLIGKKSDNLLMFRGETKDWGETALVPLIYRNNYIKHEQEIFRETQRFNDENFIVDRSTFDRLSRMQHYTAPSRLIDVSEDLLSAAYFATENAEESKDHAIIYIFEIDKNKIKHFDSDTVSAISNLAKIPLTANSKKSKKEILNSISKYKTNIKKFNKCKSIQFLLHEIRDEKPQFQPLIVPEHLTSVQFVYPKLTNNRIKTQKGAFLLFGLNYKNSSRPIRILKNGKLNRDKNLTHPIKKIHFAILDKTCIVDIKLQLQSIGIKTPFIYPEIDEVSEFLKTQFSKT